MKKIISIILLAFLGFTASSQVTLGGKVGPFGYAYRFGEGMSGTNMIYSFHAGAMANFHLTTWFALQTEVNFERKGNHFSSDDFSFTFNEDLIDMKYLTMPLLFHFNTPGKVKFFGQFGPFIGFLLSAEARSEDFIIIDPYGNQISQDNERDVTDNYRSVDAGIAGGLGVQFPLAPHLVGLVESRSSISFINSLENHTGTHSAYNVTWHVLFGVGYRFGGEGAKK